MCDERLCEHGWTVGCSFVSWTNLGKVGWNTIWVVKGRERGKHDD